jgi:RimJ/RimL family protein N-acetyltransferase
VSSQGQQLLVWLPGEPVRLETPRFVVRSIRLSDLTERYADWFANPEVTKTLNCKPRRADLDKVKAELAECQNRTRFFLGIFCKETDLLVGHYKMRCDAWNRSGSSDVVIGETEYWGKKVVAETRAALINFMFEQLGLEKVTGITFARNLPALYNYQALGFRCEGVFKKHRRGIDGGRLDMCQFALLRDEWRAKRKAQAQEPAA